MPRAKTTTTEPELRPKRTRKPAKTTEAPSPELALAHLAIEAIESKKGSNILLLDVHEISMFTDYFLICSCDSERQIRAVVSGVQELMDKQQKKPIGLEGSAESGWVLLDYASLIVHVFAPETRAYYALEELWKDAPTVIKIQ